MKTIVFFPSESTVLSIIAISVNSQRHSLLPETELQIQMYLLGQNVIFKKKWQQFWASPLLANSP